MDHQKAKAKRQLRRRRHVRRKITGTAERPRLTVFRSSKHIYAQMINDESGTTLVSASSMDPEVKAQVKYGGNKAAATLVGRVVAERARKAGIDKICFDRRSYRYHGRVAALAGLRPPRRRIPLWLAWTLAVLLERRAKRLRSTEPPLVNKARYKFLGLNLDFSIDKARNELGYRPRFAFDDAMVETMDWYKKHLSDGKE